MTLEEVRQMLSSGALAPSNEDVIGKGMLAGATADDVEYSVHCGWDIVKAMACDKEWGHFNVRLLSYIAENYSEESLRNEVLRQSSLEDHHWDWFQKSSLLNSHEYRWFFLYAKGLPQAACVIYHPKQSFFSSGDIFYIEYIAAAPWNRRNVMQDRTFGGIGTCLLKHAVEHCQNTLNLRPGFSLHALPGAMAFYEKIGMIREESMDKGSLAYYEMPEACFASFIS